MKLLFFLQFLFCSFFPLFQVWVEVLLRLSPSGSLAAAPGPGGTQKGGPLEGPGALKGARPLSWGGLCLRRWALMRVNENKLV